MRQFALWKKPITHSLDRLKWQIKRLRHSLIMWVQRTADINGFILYLHLPSGCFAFLEIWRLKQWYLCIISSTVKVGTQGSVHRHAVLGCQWYWLFDIFRNSTDRLNTRDTWANTGEKWLKNRSTQIQHTSFQAGQNRIDVKLENQLFIGKCTTSFFYARNLCCSTPRQ